MPVEEEEYEIVPLGPLRKMEKRLSILERSRASGETNKELLDIVRSNQQIVDEMVKMNSELMHKITDLTSSVNKTMEKIDEFLNRLEVTGEEAPEAQPQPAEPEKSEEYNRRIDKLEKRINSLILSTMAKQGMRIKRPA